MKAANARLFWNIPALRIVTDDAHAHENVWQTLYDQSTSN